MLIIDAYLKVLWLRLHISGHLPNHLTQGHA